MNKQQFLLLKLSEECAEVAQRCSKQIQFGAAQIQKGNEVKGGTAAPDKEAGLTNGERLKKELTDLYVLVHLLQIDEQIPPTSRKEFKDAKKAKIEKLNRYLVFSRHLGELDGDWMI